MSMTRVDEILKRSFDVTASIAGLITTGWIILIAYVLSTIDTKRNGFFLQERIGLNGERFKVIKIRTMKDVPHYDTSVTTANDPRVTIIGSFLRKAKIDELPQLINVLAGQMSFVGPRPDVPGFADRLADEERIILTVRPGITGPASLKYRNEEDLLAGQLEPEKYNREVIYPDKLRININYVKDYSFFKDLYYIFKTIVP